MGIYYSSGFECTACENSKYWDTEMAEIIPDLTWICKNKPRIQCGRCGSFEIKGADSVFCSVDMSSGGGEALWKPENLDLLWILPDEDVLIEARDKSYHGGASCSTVDTRFPVEFVKFKNLKRKYKDNFVVLFRCNKDQGVVLSYGKDAEFTKSCADSKIKDFQEEYLTFVGTEWVIPEGYIQDFDFRPEKEKLRSQKEGLHKESSVAWFECERIGYAILNENLLLSDAAKNFVGCYLVVQDEHLYKDEGKRGNVVAVFSESDWELLYNTEALQGNYSIWKCE